MGVVYRARQTSLNRLVALKMIRTGQLASAEEMERFRFEAEAAAKPRPPAYRADLRRRRAVRPALLQHEARRRGQPRRPDRGDRPRPPRRRPVDRDRRQGRPPRPRARLLAPRPQAGQHPDRRQGQPHVTDFGLAKRSKGDSGMTQVGVILGTPSYMAPEQASGGKDGLTAGTDVYSLGAVLYELLTGRPPFRASTVMETVVQVLEREPEAPSRLRPGLPVDLEMICLKMPGKEPGQPLRLGRRPGPRTRTLPPRRGRRGRPAFDLSEAPSMDAPGARAGLAPRRPGRDVGDDGVQLLPDVRRPASRSTTRSRRPWPSGRSP